MLDYLDGVPDFKKWMEQASSSKSSVQEAYQSFTARVAAFICALDVIWPDFIEYEGLILRGNVSAERLQTYLEQARQAGWSPADIEHVHNHVHLSDLFMNDPDRSLIPPEVYRAIAGEIASSWRCKLNFLFPDRRFEVGVREEEGTSPEVYAYSAT